jgi:tRNA G18 (ribose-2'-O)-methylase SpoU
VLRLVEDTLANLYSPEAAAELLQDYEFAQPLPLIALFNLITAQRVASPAADLLLPWTTFFLSRQVALAALAALATADPANPILKVARHKAEMRAALERETQLDKEKVEDDDEEDEQVVVDLPAFDDPQLTQAKPSLADSIPKTPITVVASLLSKAANQGGLARTCEVLGVQELVLASKKITTSEDFKASAMSAAKWIKITETPPERLAEFLLDRKRAGALIVGLEQLSTGSVPVERFPWGTAPVVLVLGAEATGIPAPLLHLVDHCVEITQRGKVASLNVHVAGAIALWEATKG